MNTQYFKYMLLPLALAPVTMSAQEEAEAEKVNVAFRSVAAEDLLTGVSVLDYEDINAKNNSTSLSDLQGYVSGFNGASLWGQTDFLVLVDGVPRDISNVKPDEVAQITFMKGANAVVLYGSRAAKGCILVTTKRGNDKDLQINVSANTGWNVMKSTPAYLGSAEYMTLYNEALRNDGLSAKYSDEQIYQSYAGNNPYRYPNIDMYSSDYLKKSYNRSEVVAEFRGGAKRTNYYTNIGYQRQGDYINFGEAKNNYTDRLNVRGNVDMQMSDWITAFANANATFYSSRGTVGANYWEAASTIRPNRLVPFIPASYLDTNNPTVMNMTDGMRLWEGDTFFGIPEDATDAERTSAIQDIYAAGKSKYNSRHFEFSMGVNLDLNKVLEGLTFSTMFATDYATQYTTSFNNDYATYQPTWSNYAGKDLIVDLNNNSKVDKKTGSQSVSNSAYTQVLQFNAHFDYNRTFNEVHNVNAILLANGYQLSNSGEYHRTSNANLGLQASYNYAHKYYAEIGTGLVYSAKLESGKRAGVSTAVTLGWNLAKENFLEGSIFDDLMLSTSYSVLKQDMDIDGFYVWSGNYSNTDYYFGWNSGSLQSTVSKGVYNPDLSYINRKEWNASVRASLLEKSLNVQASVFNTLTEGLIYAPSSQYPSYFSPNWPSASTLVPQINYNNNKHYGFDVAINYKKDLTNDFSLAVGATMTYYNTEASKRDDGQYTESYQHRQGTALDALWGLEAIGLFKDKAAVEAAPTQKFGAYGAGDIQYKDQNNDGVIDDLDVVDLGRGGWYGAPLTLGLNLTAKYKGLSLFVLATGGFGGNAFHNNSYYWLKGDSKYSVIARDRAIVENDAVKNYDSAAYPRLTTTSGDNNFRNSSYWMYSTDRFNIAKVQLTYDLPENLFDGKVVKGVSVFVNGANLLTIAKERETLELNVGSAPQSRFFQAGASVKF